MQRNVGRTIRVGRKVRPAVIVSPDPQGHDILVDFISSAIPDRIHLTELSVQDTHIEFTTTGLKRSSVFKAGKLLALHRSLILLKLGHLGPKLQSELDLRLLRAIGIGK